MDEYCHIGFGRQGGEGSRGPYVYELANVSTVGFKRAFEQHGTDEVNGVEVTDDSVLSTTLVEMKEGPKIYTGNPLDIYLNQDTL